MRKREIEAKFDEIVEFSGVARFLDTPVKRYSSGMFVRLGFGVAAHLEPEILLVDEVLAVGDAEFQRKCIGKMQEVSQGGRTVVFVSHNMASVRRLCSRAYFIESGEIAREGPTAQVVDAYLRHTEVEPVDGEVVLTSANRLGTGTGRITKASLLVDGRPVDTVPYGDPFAIRLTLEMGKSLAEGVVEIGISTPDGLRVLTSNSVDFNASPLRLDAGPHVIEAHFAVTLLPGEFTVDLGLHDSGGATLDWVERALRFKAGAVSQDGSEQYPWHVVRGHVRPAVTWASVDQSDPSVVPGRR
jgi:lipopolysaccharide transport system ATP-binding protein